MKLRAKWEFFAQKKARNNFCYLSWRLFLKVHELFGSRIRMILKITRMSTSIFSYRCQYQTERHPNSHHSFKYILEFMPQWYFHSVQWWPIVHRWENTEKMSASTKQYIISQQRKLQPFKQSWQTWSTSFKAKRLGKSSIELLKVTIMMTLHKWIETD